MNRGQSHASDQSKKIVVGVLLYDRRRCVVIFGIILFNNAYKIHIECHVWIFVHSTGRC